MTAEREPGLESGLEAKKTYLKKWSKVLLHYGLATGRMSLVVAGIAVAASTLGFEIQSQVLQKFKSNIKK